MTSRVFSLDFQQSVIGSVALSFAAILKHLAITLPALAVFTLSTCFASGVHYCFVVMPCGVHIPSHFNIFRFSISFSSPLSFLTVCQVSPLAFRVAMIRYERPLCLKSGVSNTA
jgi:hypothetical protein